MHFLGNLPIKQHECATHKCGQEGCTGDVLVVVFGCTDLGHGGVGQDAKVRQVCEAEDGSEEMDCIVGCVEVLLLDVIEERILGNLHIHVHSHGHKLY